MGATKAGKTTEYALTNPCLNPAMNKGAIATHSGNDINGRAAWVSRQSIPNIVRNEDIARVVNSDFMRQRGHMRNPSPPKIAGNVETIQYRL